MYSKKINQLATNLNPQSTDLIPIGDAETGQLKTTTFNNISGVSSDGVISGGIVTWTGTGLNFNISACVYYINGIRYTSPASTKTLAAADPTYDRIDVFAVNTSGEVVVVQGTPALNPIEPEGDTQTTLGLTNVTIAAGATVPSGVTREIIYDENLSSPTEWAKSATISGGTYNSGDTAFANTGTKSYLVTLTSGGTRAFSSAFVRPTEGTITDFKSLSFAIRLTTAVPSGTAINISFWNGTTIVSNRYSLSVNNTVGFNRTLTNTWQQITIPLDGSLLKFTNNKFTRFVIETVGPGYTFRFDTLCLNSGIKNPTGGGGTTSTNSFGFVNGSTGTATAAQATDTLAVVGTGLATTSATGKTLTIAVPTPIPTQTGNNGKFLTTDGSNVSWGSPTDTGITSLNSQTGTTQTFATGTSGTDFGISSASNTHTFNLPTASATNRGALSSADWSTFDGKQNAITLTTTGTSGAATLVGSTLNIPQYSGGGSMAIGGTVTSGTTGSVLFIGASSALTQDNTNFFWNDTVNRLGIGTNNPLFTLDVSGTASISSDLTLGTIGTGTGLKWDNTNNRVNIGSTLPQNVATYNIVTSASIVGISAKNSSTGNAQCGFFAENNLGYRAQLMKAGGGFTAYKSISANDLVLFNANDDGDISIYNDKTTGKIKFTSGGVSTAQMTLTSAGRLLLGTSSELTNILEVNGTSNFTGNLTVTGSTSFIGISTFGTLGAGTGLQWDNTNNRLNFSNSTPTNIANFNIVASIANTGISIRNTSTSSGNTRAVVLLENNSGHASQLFKTNSAYTTYKTVVANDLGFYNTGSGNISILNDFSTGNINFAAGGVSTAQATLTAAGRLLIGTTTESTYMLDVNGTTRFQDNNLISKNQNAATSQTLSNTTSGTASQVQILFTSSGGSANIAKYSGATTGLKIIAANDFIVYNGNGAGDIAVLNDFTTGKIKFAAGGSSTAQMTIQANGEVIVGGTTDNGAYNLQCNGTGVWGAGAYVNGSDIRLKENIKPIKSGLDYVSKMNPISYNYLKSYSKDQNIQPGFIAQELKEVFKDEEWVNGIVYEDSEFMNVAYQNLIPILTKAIQELKQEIEILKNK